jgi:cell wall-associated NlpC family hydrolase
MKNLFILSIFLIGLAGCDAFRPASRSPDNLSADSDYQPSAKNSQIKFIRDISTERASSGATVVKPREAPVYRNTGSKTAIYADGISVYNPLQFKYAILTNSPVEMMTNQRLLEFLDQWYGVRYHFGGSSKDGIDCSAFASTLLYNVYDVDQLPRMSADQYVATRRIKKKDLREGDLVFFHTLGKGNRVTHVGVYLYNSRFIHASIAGVQISDLAEGYYMTHYVGAGRVTEY